MKKITIYWSELTEAFDTSHPEANYYLDLETGQVILVLDENNQQLEDLYEENYDPDDPESAIDIDAALNKTNFPDWVKHTIREAHHVERYFGSRVITIPDRPSYESYNEMENFIEAIQDDSLRNYALGTIQGRGAFGRFRRIMQQNPAEQQRWYTYKDDNLKKRTLEWLEDIEGIEIELDYGSPPFRGIA